VLRNNSKLFKVEMVPKCYADGINLFMSAVLSQRGWTETSCEQIARGSRGNNTQELL